MKKKYSIGLTVHNLENPDILILFKCLIDASINIDFIIYHQNYFKRNLLRFINTILGKDSDEKKIMLKKVKNIKTFNIKDINSIKCDTVLKMYEPSLVLCNTGIIKQKTIKNNPNTYLLNVHGSKLPEYRGVSNIHWALWEKKDIWVTVHRINNGIDEGDILYQELLIKNDENLPEKLSNLNFLVKSAIPKAILNFLNNDNTFVEQEYIGDLTKRWYSMHPIILNIINKRLE
jgi:folate-dependent phosphoribosylglycinamide formyltransferase PurN